MNCYSCKKNTEDIYLEDIDIRLCKKCITKLVKERQNHIRSYKKANFHRKTNQEFHAQYMKEIKDLKELVKFMHEH